jgi:hypothetical protein
MGLFDYNVLALQTLSTIELAHFPAQPQIQRPRTAPAIRNKARKAEKKRMVKNAAAITVGTKIR